MEIYAKWTISVPIIPKNFREKQGGVLETTSFFQEIGITLPFFDFFLALEKV